MRIDHWTSASNPAQHHFRDIAGLRDLRRRLRPGTETETDMSGQEDFKKMYKNNKILKWKMKTMEETTKGRNFKKWIHSNKVT